MIDRAYKSILLPPVRRITRDDAEKAHEWALHGMQFIQDQPRVMQFIQSRTQAAASAYQPLLTQTLLDGLTFPSPIGIAAGVDKKATTCVALDAITTPGFIEIGSVTRRPQEGNPRPRIVRAGKHGLINAMGFPNPGLDVIAGRLASMPHLSAPLGVNIGKLKNTPDNQAAAEYAENVRELASLRKQRSLPDFYVINVSSPNTPGLRALQDIGPLTEILQAVIAELDSQSNESLALRHRLLVKLSPDLSEGEIASIIELTLHLDIGGVILTNTTLERPIDSRHNERPGGFSGSALFNRSARLVRFASKLVPRDKVLVATGGIDTVDRAYEMLQHADLIGSYTGLVLNGPGHLRHMATGVAQRMQSQGIKSLAELRQDQRPA